MWTYVLIITLQMMVIYIHHQRFGDIFKIFVGKNVIKITERYGSITLKSDGNDSLRSDCNNIVLLHSDWSISLIIYKTVGKKNVS